VKPLRSEVIILTSRDNLADAQIVIDKLDRLPLALTQAGAYLRETNTSVASYIKHYDSTWKELMEEQGRYPLQEYGHHSILTTWMISYEQVASASAEAAKLLKLWGYLDREDLWYDLLAPIRKFEEGDEVPGWLTVLVESEIKFNQAIGLLRRFSLVEATGRRSDSHSIHAVLHAWCSCLLIDDEPRIMLHLAMNIVAQAVLPKSDTVDWRLQRRLLPHGMHVFAKMSDPQHRRNLFDQDDFPVWAYDKLGRLFTGQDRLEEAERIYETVLVLAEEALGPEHTDTLETVNRLGGVYADRDELAEAEAMCQRALAGYEKALGLEHTDTLMTVNNLGNLYKAQGKLAEAEAMFGRALTAYEKALGPEHPDTLATVSGLGGLYSAQDRPVDAEAMFERALAGMEKALGPEHADTLDVGHTRNSQQSRSSLLRSGQASRSRGNV
jgi:tetratricopeptide (TPR) repeat protein